MPCTPQKAAGWRTEPPVSLPSATGTSPAATTAALPPELPPGTRSVSRGLSVGPKMELSVVLPGRTDSFTVTTQVLIAESVLVGKVPEIYLHADIFGDGYVTAAPQRGG